MSNGAVGIGDQRPLLSVQGLGKRFALQANTRGGWASRLWSEMLGGNHRPRPDGADEFWALRGVSLELRSGEGLGVLGHNGAGKSTLIKLLMGKLKPTEGRIAARGQVGAVTQLGVGFNPQLSGRKNIFISASMLGFSYRQTEALSEEIVRFAEIGEFIEQPIKTYSSGMVARLGYAISAILNPDVLLVDEVLAVGDLGFKRKCMRHIQEFRSRGGALLFVSHDLYALQFVCDRVIVLERGRMIFEGNVADGTQAYLQSLHHTELAEVDRMEAAARGEPLQPLEAVGEDDLKLDERPGNSEVAPSHVTSSAVGLPIAASQDLSAGTCPTHAASGANARTLRPTSDEHPVLIDSVNIAPETGKEIVTGCTARLTMQVRVHRSVRNVRWGFTLLMHDGSQNIGTLIMGLADLDQGTYDLTALMKDFPLMGGQYQLRGGIADDAHGVPYDDIGWQDAPHRFHVSFSEDRFSGVHAVMKDLVQLRATNERAVRIDVEQPPAAAR